MGRVYKNSGEILAERALDDDSEQEQRGRVYNGTLADDTDGSMRGGAAPAGFRKRTAKKRLSVLNVLATLAAVCTIVLLYIYNTVRVGELLREIGELDAEAQKLVSTNEVLRAEINRKSTLERIGGLAQSELGMINPRQQPVWISLDSEVVRHAADVHQREAHR